MSNAHDIEYTVHGSEMQFVEVVLDPEEAVIAEAGTMMYMTGGIEMQTIMGDGSEQTSGLFGKLWGAGKRMLTGESLFMTLFANEGSGKQKVGFSAPYPGKIVPVDLNAFGGEIQCQKDSFLCAAKGVHVNVAFSKKLGVGFFGGEGFIMQRLEGDGLAFLHAGGTIHQMDLAPGEGLRVDTGSLVGLTSSVKYEVAYIGSIKSALFGGEGLFVTHLTGPGTVWLQSLPFSRLAERVHAAAPQTGSGDVGGDD